MGKQILYLENDPGWAETVAGELAKYGDVRVIDNEREFRRTIDEIVEKENWPDLVILDESVRWTHYAPDISEAPYTVRREGDFNAGIRCCKYVRGYEGGFKVPIIFYSVSGMEEAEMKLIMINIHPNFDYNHICVVQKDVSDRLLHEAVSAMIR